MSDWIDVAREGSLAEGEHLVVDVDGTEVAVFRIEGAYYAIQDACTHDGAEIASGRLEGCEIICPRHRARFSLKTGKVLSPPAYEDLATFPVRVEDGRIQVRDACWD
ncbi:non-heme iron oxygenase ferredoxin subunit [Methylomagnum ishizawai]|uniref:non-heme iron oxygenase ferredoxin subunit n=1 Tax=Methylomagnum ishizawai TaxID=1760988 RepID=UPI001C8118EE|nr:non-heme iron oxygenase ferredoxin subunit [Methylomagnum ishizawai]